ncbi:MAG: outer membrane protein assembly factor BamA [Rickettsiales bacterium]
MKYYILFFFLVFNCNFALAQFQINISGNNRIESETIKAYFASYKNHNPNYLNEILKELYNTNLFSDVVIKEFDNGIEILVTENPVINEIKFTGNKSLKEEILKQEMNLAEREVYTKANLINDLIRISEIYKRSGLTKVAIDPKVKFLDNNRLDLIIKITENEKSRIEKIIFHNNKSFSARRLKKILTSKERKWYRSASSLYDPDRFSFDQQLLKRFYFNNGYAEFNIIDARVEYIENINRFVINYLINEGKVFHFAEASFENQYQDFNTKDLFAFLQFKQGDKFSLEKIEESVEKILDYLSNKGYAFADIDYQIENNKENLTSKVNFTIKQNRKIYIRNIKITGNNRTEDKVIRKELRFLAGDSFSNSRIERSKQRLINLGFFSNVSVKKTAVKGSNHIDIEFIVEEKPTGELNFGFGYSTTEKFLGNITIKERNLHGKAHSVAASFQKSSRSNDIDFSYNLPDFKNRGFTLGVDIFNLRTDYTESLSEIKTQGSSLKIYYEITEYLSQSLSYTYKNDEVTNVSSSASIYIKEQEGKNSYSALSESLFYDKRNDKINPSKGYYLKSSITAAGIGGDTKFFKFEQGAVNYLPIYKEKVIFKSLIKSGIIEGYNNYDIKINNRFFLGGSSFRGFETSGLGPRDSSGAALGGKYFILSTLELMFPLGLPEELGFKGSIFSDMGTLTAIDNDSNDISDDASLRLSIGMGIAWDSPLGPIRFDYAKAKKKEDYDELETFRINFGTRF